MCKMYIRSGIFHIENDALNRLSFTHVWCGDDEISAIFLCLFFFSLARQYRQQRYNRQSTSRLQSPVGAGENVISFRVRHY